MNICELVSYIEVGMTKPVVVDRVFIRRVWELYESNWFFEQRSNINILLLL
jgi:hypothetical protein